MYLMCRPKRIPGNKTLSDSDSDLILITKNMFLLIKPMCYLTPSPKFLTILICNGKDSNILPFVLL